MSILKNILRSDKNVMFYICVPWNTLFIRRITIYITVWNGDFLFFWFMFCVLSLLILLSAFDFSRSAKFFLFDILCWCEKLLFAYSTWFVCVYVCLCARISVGSVLFISLVFRLTLSVYVMFFSFALLCASMKIVLCNVVVFLFRFHSALWWVSIECVLLVVAIYFIRRSSSFPFHRYKYKVNIKINVIRASAKTLIPNDYYLLAL